jgi:putative chitinase
MSIRITKELLKKIEPYANDGIIASLAAPLSKHMTAYGIDTPLRAAHFLAQAGHESAHFKTLHEYATGQAYEGRKDLGNVYAGDGRRYKGRGIFQLTGRANYRAYGAILKLDLENDPELAADPEISVRVACEYWKQKGLSGWADRDDVNEITRRINGGYNGLQDRKNTLARAKKNLGADSFNAPKAPPPPVETIPDAPIAATPPEPWWTNGSIQATATSFFASIINGVSNPYSLAAIALIVVAGGAVFFAWYRKNKRDAVQFPVGPVA